MTDLKKEMCTAEGKKEMPKETKLVGDKCSVIHSERLGTRKSDTL